MDKSKFIKSFVTTDINVLVCRQCGNNGPIIAFKTVDEGIYCCPHCEQNGLIEDGIEELKIPKYCTQCGFKKEYRGSYQPYYASPLCFDCYMENADNKIKELEMRGNG